jgi:urease accessory protein UreE
MYSLKERERERERERVALENEKFLFIFFKEGIYKWLLKQNLMS